MASAKTKFIGADSTYKQQVADADATLKRYDAGAQNNLSQYTQNYNTSKTQMAQSNALADTGNTEDYAARGLLRSGLFVQAGDRLHQSQNNQLSSVERALQGFKSDAAIDRTNAAAQAKQVKDRAYQDAADRYAQQQYLTS